MGVRLPAEYQEVDWIECTGGQYLQLGISPSPTDVVELLFATNNNKPQSTAKNFTLYSAGDGTYQYTTVLTKGVTFPYTYGRYFSNVASENKGSYDMLSSKTDYVWLRHRSNGNTKAQSCTDVGNNYQFWTEAPQKSSTLDGDNINLRLFARIGSNTNFFVGRAKHFIVIRDNAYVLNLISCYRKADSKPGMYDLVTGTFYTNEGTGEFLVGPDVIDSISPWLVARRRLLMYKEPELYPVGTHILSMYIGDKDGGERRNFESGYGINTSTGEYYATGSGNTYASDVYVPVSPKYTYQKSDWRLTTWCFYDKDKQYISRAPIYNNLNVQTLAKFPDNVCYVRIQAYNFANQAIEITRIA